MRRHEIESLSHAIINRVESGQPAEDDTLVELKAQWPSEPAKAARRIAGHANTAQGDPILWLIGVDEGNAAVTGASVEEASDWFARVKSCFDDSWAPQPTFVAVPRDGNKTVMAITFDTDGGPYVVKSRDGLLEVPWREGTAVRSARRRDLLQILSPRAQLPTIETRSGRLQHRVLDSPVSSLTFSLELDVYLVPHSRHEIAFPFHKMKSALFTEEGTEVFEFDEFSAKPPRQTSGRSAWQSRAPNIAATATELIVGGPGGIVLVAKGTGDWINVDAIARHCEVRFRLELAGDRVGATLRQRFVATSPEGEASLTWRATHGRASFLPKPSGL
jgi:hypothetical protein